MTNFLLYFSKMGLSPASVVDYYRGSEQAFTAGRSFQSMVEVAHFHLPMMAVVILILTHLVIFIPFPNKVKVVIIIFSFAVAFLNELTGWLVRFVAGGRRHDQDFYQGRLGAAIRGQTQLRDCAGDYHDRDIAELRGHSLRSQYRRGGFQHRHPVRACHGFAGSLQRHAGRPVIGQ